jgi:MFS family permease
MNISDSFQNALNDVVVFLPRAAAFLAILLVGWIIAKWLGKLVGKLLGRVGVDKAADKSGLRRFTGKYQVSELLGKVVYFALVLFTLQLAFGAFGPNPVSDLLTAFVGWLPHLFVALLIVVVAFAVANAVFELISGTLQNASYGKTVARIVQVAIIFVGAVAALGQVGIAEAVLTPIMWAVPIMIAGIAIVGIGGGLIGPMRARWERMLNSVEEEATRLKETSGASTEDQMGRTYASARYDEAANVQTDVQAGAPGETPIDTETQARGQSDQ